jgi:glycerol kinase
VRVTDVPNASRPMIMDLESIEWPEGILRALRIFRPMLLRIVSSSDKRIWAYTMKDGPLD